MARAAANLCYKYFFYYGRPFNWIIDPPPIDPLRLMCSDVRTFAVATSELSQVKMAAVVTEPEPIDPGKEASSDEGDWKRLILFQQR